MKAQKRQKPLWSLVFAPLLIAAVCLPLAFDLIGPNGVYGVRTGATRASEAAWYATNHAAGWAGVLAGLAGGVANWCIMRSALMPQKKSAWGTMVVLAVAAVIVAVGLSAA